MRRSCLAGGRGLDEDQQVGQQGRVALGLAVQARPGGGADAVGHQLCTGLDGLRGRDVDAGYLGEQSCGHGVDVGDRAVFGVEQGADAGAERQVRAHAGQRRGLQRTFDDGVGVGADVGGDLSAKRAEVGEQAIGTADEVCAIHDS